MDTMDVVVFMIVGSLSGQYGAGGHEVSTPFFRPDWSAFMVDLPDPVQLVVAEFLLPELTGAFLRVRVSLEDLGLV